MVDVGTYPVPPGIATLLVFGGTFDPPHRAHVELPIAARDATGADWLLYVPAGRSPHKRENPVATDEQRIAMLRAALDGIERVSISTVECEGDIEGGAHRPPSYTVDTLGRLSGLTDGSQLRLLIGADQAVSFHRWREPKRIIELAEPLVMLRAPLDDRATLLGELRERWTAPEAKAWAARIVEVPTIDVSATRVRALLRDGALDDPALEHALAPPVLDFIRTHHLYERA